MVSHKILSKFLIIAVFIFLLLDTTSLGLYQDKSQNKSLQDPFPRIFGQVGENHWYIIAVTILFEYDPEKVKEIQYYLDDSWHIYSDPFVVEPDGVYMIPWFWMEISGRPHDGISIEFKIDKTAPTIELNKKTSGKNKMIFTAIATDEVSKIEGVEFYLDDVLIQTDNETPYEYTWTGEEKQTVYAIAYNYAGHFAKSDNVSTPRPFLRNNNIIQRFFVLIHTILFRF